MTAQGREQSLQDVPVAVSVMSGEQLNDFNINSLTEAQARLPNVNIAEAPSPVINIRGVGSGNNWGFQQAVGTFVDGIYRGRAVAVRSAFFDVERLEVLKGPQTTFFGANTIAGALNITTRKPGWDFDVNASALYGSFGEYNLEAGVDVPLHDTLAVRLAGRLEGMNGFVETPFGDAPNRDGMQLRGALRFEPAPWIRSDLRVDYGESETIGAQPFQLVGCPPPAPADIVGAGCRDFLAQRDGVIDDELDYRSDTPLDYVNFDFVEAAWTNAFDVGADHELILKTGYYDHSSNQQFTGIPFPITTGPAGTTDGFPVRVDEGFDQFSQEIRFQSNEGGVFDYMVGAYYAESSVDFENTVGFFFNDFGRLTQLVARGIIPTSPLPTPVLTNEARPGDHVSALATYNTEDEDLSLFGALTIRPTDALRINLGARWSRISKFATRSNARGVTDDLAEGTFVPYNDDTQLLLNSLLRGSTENFGGGNNPGRRVDKDFMPSASVQYDVTDNLMAYVSYAEGFKAGGFSTGNFPISFEPEFVKAYEAGIKASPLYNLDVNLAVFRNDFSNLQENVIQNLNVDIGGGNVVNTINTIVQNVAASRSQGAELDVVWRASDWLTLNAAIAYLDANYQSYPNAPCSQLQLATQARGGGGTPLFRPNGTPITVCDQLGGFQDLSGAPRAFAPDWSGNVSATFRYPVNDTIGLSVTPVMYFKSDHFLSPEADPLVFQSGFAKFDLRIAARAESGWELALIARNLTDEVTGSFAGAVTGATGSIRYLVDRPRSFAVQVSYDY
ncbi:TonB-dependent receptor [Altericroceibacterium xinjiangense]|uniref:TonB-dependent receptor n=1 Tax=Altericroceibacterium xinjiangense TaxID=762261 RepID=UPI0013DEC31B|nr:TonB-dependent receptor [Altericroceibacterium xinjiangense]